MIITVITLFVIGSIFLVAAHWRQSRLLEIPVRTEVLSRMRGLGIK